MNQNNIIGYLDLFGAFFEPLIDASQDRETAKELIQTLGYQTPDEIAAFDTLIPILEELDDTLVQIDDFLLYDEEEEGYVTTFVNLFLKVEEIIEAFKPLITSISLELNNSDIPIDDSDSTQLLQELFDYLFINVCEELYPRFHSALRLLGLFHTEYIAQTTPSRIPYWKQEIRWNKISGLIQNPQQFFTEIYWSSTGEMHYSRFIAAVRDFALSLGILADFDAPNADVIASFNDGNNLSNYEDLDDLDILRFPFLPFIDANVGCQIYPVVDDLNFKITGAGLGFYFGDEQEILISERNKLRWNAISTIQDGLGFILRQNGDFEFRHQIFTSNPSSILDGADAELKISWIAQTLEVYETLLDIGISQGIRAEIKRSQLTFGIETQNETDASIELSLSTVFFFLVGNEADSFLKSTLPHQPITIPLELTIIFSALKGFYLKGNSGLEGAVSLNLSISNIFSLHQLFLGVSNVGSDINAFIALNAALNLGPILTEIDGIGLEGSLTFPENNSGNLGPLNVDLGFKPPKGLAIEIEASVVSGGGYLYFDREKAQYSGIIQLEFEGLTLTAIGLLTTRMPDGTSGYSLLIILTVEDFQPHPTRTRIQTNRNRRTLRL